jgi:hypothetical protein
MGVLICLLQKAELRFCSIGVGENTLAWRRKSNLFSWSAAE